MKLTKRGSFDRRAGRFPLKETVVEDDSVSALQTQIHHVHSKSILTSNTSPDIAWDRTINPYAGCEHGCAYCYARPSHGYLGMSPALDFESQIFSKDNAAVLLREAFLKPGYTPVPLGLGTNTDPYQPAERVCQVTRQILLVLQSFQHPVTVLTKGELILRDIDILSDMASRHLCRVQISISTLNSDLAMRMEPRASLPKKRLEVIRQLTRCGIPVRVMVAPVVPGLNLDELEMILVRARESGATSAGYVLLRLPFEVRGMFGDWLRRCYPQRWKKVLGELTNYRADRQKETEFITRMTGSGEAALKLKERFINACQEYHYIHAHPNDLCYSLFNTRNNDPQLSLF